jgi:hypothetical protein
VERLDGVDVPTVEDGVLEGAVLDGDVELPVDDVEAVVDGTG